MKKLSNITESVWTDIQKRSSGEDIRKEDSVNYMSPDEFCEYLKTTYKVDSNHGWHIFINPGPNEICIPFGYNFVENKKIKTVLLFFNYEKCDIYINNNDIKYTPKLYNELKKQFDVCSDNKGYFEGYTVINPLNAKQVTNSFVIEVLNFIIDNLDDSVTLGISKKTNESVWTDMQKRSSGEDIRQEDDVNNLDCKGLVDYLKKHYKPLNSFAIITNVVNIISMPIIKITTHNCIMYSPKSKFGKICITNEIIDSVDGLLEKLNTHFEIKEEYGEDTNGEYTFYYVSPKDGSDVTNKFFIEVLDFLLDNIPNSPNYKKSFEKRS